jgi:uncharacterized RDD family membrane protein YckC
MPPPVASTASNPSASPSAEEIRTTPASLWRRGFAWIIDAVVLLVVVGGLLNVAMALSGSKEGSELAGFDGMVTRLHQLERIWIPGLFLGGLFAVAYCALSAFLFGGRTLGRAAAGIRLVDTSGIAPGPLRAVARAFLAALSVIFCFAGFWWALFDRKGQALHDKITATYVVRP